MGTNVKQTPIPVVPRNLKMVNADGTPTRSGQLLLEQLQASSTIFGTHDTRPAPGDAPSGALYFETDRGVLYSNENGNWQYVAGTMYGTLSPDQRPTDLGQYDGGFQFVANDTDPAIRGRSFIWDGTEWIETTQVLYGTHSGRPAVADAPARCLYIEVDRSSVIYQNQGTAWEYIAGTMFGTISPDQRPTDLGPPDAGFDFRTNVDPARQFLWSGGDWVETTPIRYGTHAERLATPIAGLISGMFWTETDRGNVIYETQGGVWLFLDGTMWGTLTPDQRPTDLGVNDDGFTFLATVTPLRSFIWASPVWVETTNPTGSSALINPNVVIKVGATTGGIVEGGITDLSAGNSGMVQITAAGNVGIHNPASTLPDTHTSNYHLIVGDTGASATQGEITVVANTAGGSAGNIQWANYAIGAADKRIAIINSNTDGAVNSGLMSFFTANSGTVNERMRITSAGRVGISLPSPIDILSIAAVPYAASQDGGIRLQTPGNELNCRYTLKLDSGGNGRNSFEFQGLENMSMTGTGVGFHLINPSFYVQLSGDSAAKPATSTWSVVSDLRLKQNIEPMKDDSLALLGRLDWVRFEYNGQASTPVGAKAVGLVAQELDKQLPEAVRTTKTKLKETDAAETDVLAIDYHHIIVHSARAIQQLDAEVKNLKAAMIGKPPLP